MTLSPFTEEGIVPITEFPAGGLGSAIAPEDGRPTSLEHLSAASVVLASGATRITTAKKVVHVPKVTSDGSASWYSELEEIDEDGPAGDELVLIPKKVAELVRLVERGHGRLGPGSSTRSAPR